MHKGLVTVVISCVLLLSGSCTTHGPHEGKLILTYTRWGDPAELESTRELIAQFEKENPDIKVRVDVVSWGQYWQKMKTAVVTGTAQDVWLMSPAYVEEYAGPGHVLDLMPYVKADPTFNVDDYFARSFDDFCFTGEGDELKLITFEEGVRSGAKLYAFTRDYNCRVLYYNRDHFDALGLSYPNENWTWDDLVRTAKKLTIDFDGDGIIDQWGYASLEYRAFAATIGGELLDVERRKSTYGGNGDDEKRVLKAIRFCQDLIYKHKVHPPPAIQIDETETFITGKASMMVSGIWNVRSYNNSEYLWDITLIPVDKSDRQRHMADGGVAHCIYSGSRHKDEAWKLVKFLSSELSQRELARSGTSVPVLRKAALSEDFLAPFDRPQEASYQLIFKNLVSPRCRRRAPKGYQEYTRKARDILDAVWRNNRTPEEACRMIDEMTDTILAEKYPEKPQ